MNQLLGQVTQLFLQYSIKQRMIISGVLIGFLSAVIVLVVWSNRTEYDLLYSNLEATAASSVVADMRSNKIPFRLENGGTTIYAPTESISELRLRFAQNGYIKDSVTGYELFEENSMGMTTFMQRLNFKRALEGELMRTINQFPEVQKSRVHLVIPEDQLFENDKKGSASVVLHLLPSVNMRQKQIKGIAALVANSVDGISTKEVVVMDEDGNVLIEGEQENELLSGVGSQFELQQAFENNLQQKVVALVGGVVGNNNTVVKVAAELNFDRIERVQDNIDPETSILVSENTYKEMENVFIDSTQLNVEKVVRNYEFSRSHETYISNSGNIKRLTVAVLVNGKYDHAEDDNGDMISNYTPRSEEELGQIASLVKSAVGYNEDRGDIIEVQNMQLSAKPMIENTGFVSNTLPYDIWEKLITYLLLAIGLFFAYKLLRGMLSTSITQLGLPGAPEANPALAGAGGSNATKTSLPPQPAIEEEYVSDDVFMKKLSPEARAKMRASDKMTEEVITFAGDNPENATKLLRSWITQAGQK